MVPFRSSLSLPLLEGLSRRPSAADDAVVEIFKIWKARLLLARALESRWKIYLKRREEKELNNMMHLHLEKEKEAGPPPAKRRRRGYNKQKEKLAESDLVLLKQKWKEQLKNQKLSGRENRNPNNSLSSSTRTKDSYKFDSSGHWLIHSMASPVRRERQVACRILVQGCPLDSASIWTCLEILIRRLMQMADPCHETIAVSMICWICLLKHLIVNVLSSDERLALSVHPTMGLRWLCRFIWKMARLASGKGTSKIISNRQVQNIIRICLSLVDLLHAFVLTGSDENVNQIHSILWSSKKLQNLRYNKTRTSHKYQSISPLACLVGTFHLWKSFSNNKSMERYLLLLKQLVDPGLIPKIEPLNSPGNCQRDHRDRLAVTCQSTCSTSNIADLNKSSRTNCRLTSTEAGPTSAHIRNDLTSNIQQTSYGYDGKSELRISVKRASPAGARSMAESMFIDSISRDRHDDVEGIDELEYHSNNIHPNTVERSLTVDLEDGGNRNDKDDDADGFSETDGERHFSSNIESNDDGYSSDGEKEYNDSLHEDNEEADHASFSDEIHDGEDNIEEIETDDDDADERDDIEEENVISEDHIHEEDDDDNEDNDAGEEILIDDDEMPQIEEGLLELHRDVSNARSISSSSLFDNRPTASNGEGYKKRLQIFVEAALEVLALQHPISTKTSSELSVAPLSMSSEESLLYSVINVLHPAKKPFNSRILIKRAHTQEEFFRGSLSKNPISINVLESHGRENQAEPTVRDLRQYIANDLQMGDSAELLELIVANKILDVDLKLRVVVQTIWKDYCIQNYGASSTLSISSLFSGNRVGRGISAMLFSNLDHSLQRCNATVTSESPVTALPIMVVTYRLTGVDGEATEDTVRTLKDPEAPPETPSPQEIEHMLEEKYGITRLVTKDRGVSCLLLSLETYLNDMLRKIRRDDVLPGVNYSRVYFKKSFYPGLKILICCSKLPGNRQLLLNARAPTILLRLLLDVLHALEDDSKDEFPEKNATAIGLQELIEVLASHMSRSSSGEKSANDLEEDAEDDASVLHVLLQAIESSSLSRPLRNNIAKLLPYLTYGKTKLSQELASEFLDHVSIDRLDEYEREEECEGILRGRSLLMDTFIHASISLPANEVCNTLRMELISCGFVERIARYIMEICPSEPPHWSPSLWPQGEKITKEKQKILEKHWKKFLLRPGLKAAFEILIGLSRKHQETQNFLGDFECGHSPFLRICHWLETNTSAGIGSHAETLLDEFADSGSLISQNVKIIREKTRDRKREIAMDRRKKAMAGMSRGLGFNSVRETSTSILAPVMGSLSDSCKAEAGIELEPSAPVAKRQKKSPRKVETRKPAWMKDLESIEDETGLTCAVCQEGIKNQPSALLGLYAYVKKVVLTTSAGSRSNIDGTNLLIALPSELPKSVHQGTHAAVEWFSKAKAAGVDLLKEAASSSSANKRRDNYYTTTVSAGNAIHISCHERARQADRNHPKAAKSEWEGASLRNSRVNCNVVLPLVSSRSSTVSLGAVEQALTDHQTAIANLIGLRPKSNLWTTLFDVRLLLLRMAYGEPLNADCGGGSLASNVQLIFYQLSMAKMFESEAQIDSPLLSLHARSCSSGLLAACAIVDAEDYNALDNPSLLRGIADTSVMACITCILFYNTKDEYGSGSECVDDVPHHKRRWLIGRKYFLRGLLNCAGRRHALGIRDSGCLSGRNVGTKHSQSTAFVDWKVADETQHTTSRAKSTSGAAVHPTPNRTNLEIFGAALRPFIVLFAMIDQLSSDYTSNMDDASVRDASSLLVEVIESCRTSKNIHELLLLARISLTADEIVNEMQRGLMSA